MISKTGSFLPSLLNTLVVVVVVVAFINNGNYCNSSDDVDDEDKRYEHVYITKYVNTFNEKRFKYQSKFESYDGINDKF